MASSVKGQRMSKAVVGRIQKEFESRENKLKHDLDEVKAGLSLQRATLKNWEGPGTRLAQMYIPV